MQTKLFIKSGGTGEYTYRHEKSYQSVKKNVCFQTLWTPCAKVATLKINFNIKNKLEKT